MANTFTQIYIQVVFAVQNRKALIHSSWEEELFKYITGIQIRGKTIVRLEIIFISNTGYSSQSQPCSPTIIAIQPFINYIFCLTQIPIYFRFSDNIE